MAKDIITKKSMNLDGEKVEINGTDNGEVILGNADSAVVNAGGGDDVVVTSTGKDEVNLGSGDDYAFTDNAPKPGVQKHLDELANTSDPKSVVENHFPAPKTYVAAEKDAEGNVVKSGGVQEMGNDDVVVGGTGKDTIFTGVGDDVVYTANKEGPSDGQPDIARGGKGDDHLIADGGGDDLAGNEGHDILDARNATSTATRNFVKLGGNEGRDTFFGSNDPDLTVDMSGGTGADTFYGGAGRDQISGGAGDDTVVLSEGNDHILGRDGYDKIVIPAAILANLNGNLKVELIEDGEGLRGDMNITWTNKAGETFTQYAGDDIEEIVVQSVDGEESFTPGILASTGGAIEIDSGGLNK